MENPSTLRNLQLRSTWGTYLTTETKSLTADAKYSQSSHCDTSVQTRTPANTPAIQIPPMTNIHGTEGVIGSTGVTKSILPPPTVGRRRRVSSLPSAEAAFVRWAYQITWASIAMDARRACKENARSAGAICAE